MVAPAQWGQKGDGGLTYDRSMVLDAWGRVLPECADGDGFALASVDLDYVDRFRADLPALGNLRPEAYGF